MSDTTQTASPSTGFPRWLGFGLGGAALVGAGLAAGLLLNKPTSNEADASAGLQVAQVGSGKESAKSGARAASAQAACSHCGVIESVRAVQREGKATGVGAVTGGVVGGVVGNQMGGGNGKTAMTVLGAIGGGMAGNEIEKKARSETVYEINVRMDDGSKRTVTQSTALAAGARVQVDGHSLHVLPATKGTSSGAQ